MQVRPIQHKIWNPEMECISRDELLHIQSERLVKSVRHEYDNVKFYRDRMDAAGVKPEDIRGIEDLKYLPFMDKADLRDAFPFGLLAVPKKDIVRIQGSSGTTGHPIVSGYTRNDVDVWSEMMARTLTAAGGGAEDIVQVSYGLGLFTGGFGAYQGADTIGAMVLPMSSGNTQRQILMMKELGATMLCCTPSYAAYLGETIRDMGLDPNKDLKLKAGCFGAEPWTEAMRQKIEELLCIDACDIYGLTEIAGPGVSYECLVKNGMHICEDHVIAEIINPVTGEQLPYGTEGELVFTTITKTGMPMMRYRTHDLVTLTDKKCDCGRTLARMGRVTGRSDDMMVIRGVNVFPSQIESVLVATPGVSPNYMLIADRVNHADTLEIQLELTEEKHAQGADAAAKVRQHIYEQVRSVVGISTTVTIVPPKTIQRSEGKAKRVDDRRKI